MKTLLYEYILCVFFCMLVCFENRKNQRTCGKKGKRPQKYTNEMSQDTKQGVCSYWFVPTHYSFSTRFRAICGFPLFMDDESPPAPPPSTKPDKPLESIHLQTPLTRQEQDILLKSLLLFFHRVNDHSANQPSPLKIAYERFLRVVKRTPEKGVPFWSWFFSMSLLCVPVTLDRTLTSHQEQFQWLLGVHELPIQWSPLSWFLARTRSLALSVDFDHPLIPQVEQLRRIDVFLMDIQHSLETCDSRLVPLIMNDPSSNRPAHPNRRVHLLHCLVTYWRWASGRLTMNLYSSPFRWFVLLGGLHARGLLPEAEMDLWEVAQTMLFRPNFADWLQRFPKDLPFFEPFTRSVLGVFYQHVTSVGRSFLQDMHWMFALASQWPHFHPGWLLQDPNVQIRFWYLWMEYVDMVVPWPEDLARRFRWRNGNDVFRKRILDALERPVSTIDPVRQAQLLTFLQSGENLPRFSDVV